MFYFILKSIQNISLGFFSNIRSAQMANVNSLEKVHIYKTPAPTKGVAI